MTDSSASPFSVPARIEASHDRVRAYWAGLRRGENAIPFWDDVKLASLDKLADDAMLLDVFGNPARFRLAIVGKNIEAAYGRPIDGKFLDELDLRPPFDKLAAQCRTAVERRTPTYFHSEAYRYSRLVLPLWGEGRVSMLLAAVVANSS